MSEETSTKWDNHLVYMRFPGTPYAYCELECSLHQTHRALKAVFDRVATGRLAHKIGLRDMDILTSINLTEVTGVSVPSIIDTLLWLDVSRPIVIGIKRIRQEEDKFWWFLFKLIVKDGKPYVDVISSLHNATGDSPEFGRDFQELYRFTYQEPPEKINIIQRSSQLYLNVTDEKLEFNQLTGLFYMYKYSTSAPPSEGVPTALVKMPSEGRSDSCIETEQEDVDKIILKLTSFPGYMTRQRPILSNGRFFFLKTVSDSAHHLFESEIQTGYCITENPVNHEAVAEKPASIYSEMLLYLLGPASP